MHAIKGHWAGQVFATATSNDTGGKKSRIRRSKEERKTMVEGFIKKYQKTNDGNFPSLNLTHKEVGGSFYTVREIVREIIQENRVLAPPKGSLEDYDPSEFLEHHPLGFIAMEPQSYFSASNIETHILADGTSEDHISSSSLHSLDQPFPLESYNEEILNGISNHCMNTEDVLDSSHQVHTPKNDNFENDIAVADGLVLEQHALSDESLKEATVRGKGNETLSDERLVNQNDQIFDRTEDSVKVTYTEAAVMEIMNKENDGAMKVDREHVISHMNSDIVVETFPLRPVSRSIHETDGGSGKVHVADRIMEDKTTQHDEITLDQNSSHLVSHMAEMTLLDSTVEYHIESKEPLQDGTEVPNSIKQLIPEDSIPVGKKSSGEEDTDNSPKGSNSSMNRINLETWERSTKRHESYSILAQMKALISAFVKFWTA